jgi:nicotinamidase/pyrazinamidase
MNGPDATTALLVVDMQNDFCPGGALAVAGADLLAPTIAAAAHRAGTVVATRDWHPPDHRSFAGRGGPWPVHCVAGTDGAQLHPAVAAMRFDRVQDKGTDRDREAYSGFDGTDLGEYLRGRGVERVLVTGVATDYCVRATALDAIRAGFETTVLTDAVAPVERRPDDGAHALREVAAAGGMLDRVALLRDERTLEPVVERKARRLREVMDAAGRGKAVIGLSGGIDSAVAAALTARAIGPEHVVAVRLPSRHTEQVHIDDAGASAVAAGLPEANLLTIRIDPVITALESMRPTLPHSAIREGNASARARMIVIYDLAQELHALVIGTENRTENLLGYFTRFGDAASDIEPITDLYKTEVRAAARVLGQPQAVLDKHPTAGLWGGQTDEDELGFTYHDADLALVSMADLGMTVEQAAERTGVDVEVVRRVRARADAVAWKHAVPHVLR